MVEISKELISSIIDQIIEKEDKLNDVDKQKVLDFIIDNRDTIDPNISYEELFKRIRKVIAWESIFGILKDLSLEEIKEFDEITSGKFQTTKQDNEDWREEFIEEGADLEHQRWAHWQQWCHEVLRKECPSPELEMVLARWDKQINTPYLQLTEKEKESDREQTRHYLPLIERIIQKEQQKFMKWLEDHYWDSLENDKDRIIKHVKEYFKGK
jgi:hypothetical protein